MITTQEVREKPILFSSAMVRAILDGIKSQTRRVVKPQPTEDDGIPDRPKCEFYHPAIERNGSIEPGPEVFGFSTEDAGWPCPYGAPGDRLWVRETFGVHRDLKNVPLSNTGKGWICYRVDLDGCPDSLIEKWRPGIHMPRKLSRITLEITAVRVERLQDISHTDCEAEGLVHAARSTWICPVADGVFKEGRDAYKWLWDSINGKKYPWDSNPWTWVLEFKRI